MSLISKLYTTMLELSLREQELSDLKEEYDSYRKIVESNCNNKKVKDIKKHVSWLTRDELNKKAREVDEQEWLEWHSEKVKREERIKRRQREEEEKKKE